MPKIDVSEDLVADIAGWQRRHKVRRRADAVERLIEGGLILEQLEARGFDTAAFVKQKLREAAARLDGMMESKSA